VIAKQWIDFDRSTSHSDCQSDCKTNWLSKTAPPFARFRLGQYDRAKAALDVAFALDPTNPNTLIHMALLDMVAANKERSKRSEFRSNAYEYAALVSESTWVNLSCHNCCLILEPYNCSTSPSLPHQVNAMDPSNSSALNILANHYFHSWRVVPLVYSAVLGAAPSGGHCALLDASHLVAHNSIAREVSEGDHVRIRGKSKMYTVARVVARLPVRLRWFQTVDFISFTADLCFD
jgi:hypothetical protein